MILHSPLRFLYPSFFILGMMSIMLAIYPEKYSINGINLIETAETGQEIRHGNVVVPGQVNTRVTVTSNSTRGYAGYYYVVRIDKNRRLLHLASDVKPENIEHGNKHWAAARLAVYFLDSNKVKLSGTIREICRFYHDGEQISLDQTIDIPEKAGYVMPAIEFINTSGSLSATNIELTYTEENDLYRITRITLLISWVTAIGIFVIYLSRDIVNRQMIYPLFITTAMIIALIILPQNIKLTLLDLLPSTEHMAGAISAHGNYLNKGFGLMKVGHFFVFTTISLFACLAFEGVYKLSTIALNLVLFTIMTETIQLLVLERTPSIMDVIIDTCGILFGLFLLHMSKIFFKPIGFSGR